MKKRKMVWFAAILGLVLAAGAAKGTFGTVLLVTVVVLGLMKGARSFRRRACGKGRP